MNKPAARTVPALLAELAAGCGRHEALVDGARRWTWAMLAAEVETVACALAAAGIRAGDRVGILAGNRAEWLFTHFATMSLGAISVGLNTWATAHELAWQLAHAEVRLLVVEPRFRERDFLALVAQAGELEHGLGSGLPALGRCVVLAEEAPAEYRAWPDFLAAGAVLDASDVARASAAVGTDDVACLLYTSGSTALPKGVPLVHGKLIDNMWAIGERQHLAADDRLWLAVSLFWSLACVNALFALATHRGTIVLQHHFDAGEALALIEGERCSVLYATPNMVQALDEHPDRARRDLGSLRTGVTIGTPAQVARAARLGCAEICNVYGLTEAYGNSTVTDSSLPLAQRVETVGHALDGVEVAVLCPDTLVPRATGEAGEIVLRGNVMPGYWHDPVRSAEAFTADGWFRTGDLGLLDADGYLYYRGRLKEMVKTGGINVAPAEVEQVLATHPAVELAFVTGIPDARLDEALAAVVVLRGGAGADAGALAAHCRERLAAYKTPRHFRFVTATELPLTTTGKLKRNALAGLFT
ncbi:MAG: AMP-binding protein [Gammaproteobacteria bacterium]